MPIILPPPEPAALFHGFRNHEAKTFLENTKRPVSETKDLLQNQKSLNENTSLIWAIRHGADFSVIKQMLDIGGKDLVLKQNNFGDNAVHQAVWSGSDFDIFKLLVDVGGTDVLSQRDIFGNTPFHVACYWGASKKTIEYLVEVGGKTLLEIENDMEQRPYAGVDNKEVQAYLDSTGGHVYTEHVQEFFRSKCKDLTFMQLLWANNLNEAERRLDDPGQRGELKEKGEGPGWNCLSFSIWLHVHAHSSFQPKLSSLIKRMVQYGGEELISSLNDAGCNALHYAAYHKAPFWIIKCLVEAGGNDIIHVMNEWGNTPLHDACAKGARAEIIEYLAKHGGVEAISKKANNKDKKSPLDILLDDKPASNPLILALQKAWYVHDQRTTTMDKDIITKTLKWAETVDPSLIASNNFVKNLLNQSFCCRQYQVIILLDLYVQIAIVSAVSLGLEKIYHDSATVIVATPTILIVCVTWLIVREVLELFSSRLETYGRSYENYIDISQIVLFVWCIGIFRQVDEENHYDLVGSGSFRGIMISATAVSWLGLSVVIGHLNYNMSVFISAFVMIIFELIPFAFVTIMVVAAFAQFFFIISAGDRCNNDEGTEWECTITSSYFQSFAMLLNANFEFLDWKPDNWQQTAVSFCFAVVVGILLLNILIAKVTNVFTEVTDESQTAFWTNRLDFVGEVNAIMRKLKPIMSKLNKIMSKLIPEVIWSKLEWKQPEEKVPRRPLGVYEEEWMMKCHDKDMKDFFMWWYYAWKKDNKRPPLRTRLKYFYKYASMEDIMFPGQVFQNILFGRKYNEDLKGAKMLIATALSYLHFLAGFICAVVIFVLGLVSFGFLWPKEMNEVLFFGPVNTDDHKVDDKSEQENQVLKNKVERLEKQVSNIERLVEKQVSNLERLEDLLLQIVKKENN